MPKAARDRTVTLFAASAVGFAAPIHFQGSRSIRARVGRVADDPHGDGPGCRPVAAGEGHVPVEREGPVRVTGQVDGNRGGVGSGPSELAHWPRRLPSRHTRLRVVWCSRWPRFHTRYPAGIVAAGRIGGDGGGPDLPPRPRRPRGGADPTPHPARPARTRSGPARRS